MPKLPTVLVRTLENLRRAKAPQFTQAALLCTHMSGLVRTGMSLTQAWEMGWKEVFQQDGQPLEEAAQNATSVVQARRMGPTQVSSGDVTHFVAQACAVSVQLGAPIVTVLEDISQNVSDIQQIDQSQARSTAGPMISARVLALLPTVGVLGSAMLGVKTLPWLIHTGAGRVCFALAATLQIVGVAVSRHLLRKTKADNAAAVRKIQWCLLASIGLRAGASIPATLQALGRVCGNEELLCTAKELQVAVPWGSSWAQGTGVETQLLQQALASPWKQGISAVPVLETAVRQERNQLLLAAEHTAGRLGVQLVVPLGLCYLPAFVLVGLVPAMVLIGGQTMGAM